MIKRAIVAGLETACSLLDHLPLVWYVRGHGWTASRWDGQLGCLLGFATWSAELDDHWGGTGHWIDSRQGDQC